MGSIHNLSPSPSQNRLLAALPGPEFERLAAHLELVPMALGSMVYGPGELLQHAYFPTDAVISLHCVMESGATAETAGVGNEGMIGVSLFMGGNTTPSSAVVKVAGHAYRLERQRLLQEFNGGGLLQRLLLLYIQALMTQMTQTAACNLHHSVEQRLCRWLLLAVDRSAGRDLAMTHELVAGMLGVRREGVTEAAGRLQQAGCISYRRGHISVLDRTALEARACECYAVVRKETARLLSDALYRQGESRAATGSDQPAVIRVFRPPFVR
jgi:CRP-like cAMP-binding protein